MRANAGVRHSGSGSKLMRLSASVDVEDGFKLYEETPAFTLGNSAKRIISALRPSKRPAAPTNPLHKYEKVAQKALKLAGNGTLTFEHLRKAGLDKDIIDALGAIAGYTEAQIAAAVVCTILGVTTLPSGTKVLLPTALMGGVNIILQTA